MSKSLKIFSLVNIFSWILTVVIIFILKREQNWAFIRRNNDF